MTGTASVIVLQSERLTTMDRSTRLP